MRTLGFVGAIGLVVGLGVPAFAGDKTAPELFAVSQLSTVQVMTDKQLTSVEGMSYKRHHGYSGPVDQYNGLGQLNMNEGCGCGKGKRWGGGEVSQENFAEQLNSVYGKHGRISQENWADQANVNVGGRYIDVDQSNVAGQANIVGLSPMVR